MDIERILSGRALAMERTALPSIAARAASLAGSMTVEQLTDRYQALVTGQEIRQLPVRRVGDKALIPVFGILTPDSFLAWWLGGTTYDSIIQASEEAANDAQVAETILVIDSPGGDAMLASETAARLRELRAVKPIRAIARGWMASAALWIGAQATEVIATPSALVGSVGVFILHVDVSALNERIGVKPTYIATSPRKVETSPDIPLSDDTRAHLQAQVDEVFGRFVADLAAGRRITSAKVKRDFGDGRVFSAEEAKRRGIVDRVATLDALVGPAGIKSGPARAAAEALQRDRDWLDCV